MYTIGRVVLFGLLAWQAAKATEIELISRAPAAAAIPARGDSLDAMFSPDGTRVLFSSNAPDLVKLPGDGRFHLYVLERATGAIQLVSTNTAGERAHGESFAGGISRDNRYVAFKSAAGDLGPADTNRTFDIYVREVTSGAVTLVSHNLDGTGAGNDRSENAHISDDGEWVVFESNASDLTATDTNHFKDLFAWKRSDGSLRLVSAGLDGNSIDADPDEVSISRDGRFVLFSASGENYTLADSRNTGEIYLRDLQTGTTKWVSAALSQLPPLAGATCGNPVMSRDARFVFFLALPPGTLTPSLVRVDLHDDSIILISSEIPALQSNLDDLLGPVISDDGQFAVFADATNLLYWSAASGQTTIVDGPRDPEPGRLSEQPVLSHDGTKVAFMSIASGLVPGVGNGALQLYVKDMISGQIRLVTRAADGSLRDDHDYIFASFSADDFTLLFETAGDGLVLGDDNGRFEVFAWRISDGALSLLSSSRASSASATAFGGSSLTTRAVSADGRFVAFTTLARLSANDTNDFYDVYLYDRVLSTNVLVSAGTNGFSMGGGNAGTAAVSADGNRVFFESSVPLLAGPDDTRGGRSLYVRDIKTGRLRNVSLAIRDDGYFWQFTPDSRFVFIGSFRRPSLRYDLDTDVVVTFNGGNPVYPSPDGSRVVYQNSGQFLLDFSNMVIQKLSSGYPAAFDGTNLVYLQPTTISVTNLVTGELANLPAPSTKPAANTDLRIIAYESRPSANAVSDIYIFDRLTRESKLISRSIQGSGGGNGSSRDASVSADGRFIAFESSASDLVPDDTNGMKDVFVYDRWTDRLTLASHKLGGIDSGNSLSTSPTLSADGKFVVFGSFAGDLVEGDLNSSSDVFRRCRRSKRRS
jgi:Tol biopolymer transport system component